MRGMKFFFLAMVAVAGLILGGCGGDNETYPVISYNGKFLYVNNCGTTNTVSAFAIKANGTLEELAGSPFATGGDGSGIAYYAANNIALARGKKLLFASNRADSTVSVFAINSTTGALTAIGTPVASGGVTGYSGSLAVDDSENFLFVANDDAGDTGDASISVFAIAADGTLTPVAGSPFDLAGVGADGISLNPAGNLLYVAAPSSNQIVVLNVAADGTLTQILGSPFDYTAGNEITSFVLSSSTVGLSGATGGVLASYNIDSNGRPVLLDSLILGGNNQAVTTTRKGKLAIVSGGNTGSISVVKVEQDGVMSLVPGSPFATAGFTSGYALANPNGRYLYATETGGVNQIEAFIIDSSGALTTINTYALPDSGVPTGLVIY